VKKLHFLILSILLLISCQKEHFFDESVQIPDNEWNINSTVKFRFSIDDITKTYNLIININHHKNYQYNNLWLFIKTTAPNGNYQYDTVNCYFTDDNYKWIGDKNGEFIKYSTFWADSVSFVENGEYFVEIQQGLRQDKINMIKEVGLIIDKNQ